MVVRRRAKPGPPEQPSQQAYARIEVADTEVEFHPRGGRMRVAGQHTPLLLHFLTYMAALVVIAVGPAQTLAQMPEASVAAKITIVAIEVAGAILLAAMFSRRLKQAPNAQKRPPQDAGPTT